MTITNLPNCYHCGLEVNTGEQFCEVIDGVCQVFCCPACKMVAQTIISGGMKSFYQFRTRADSAPVFETLQLSFEVFDDRQFQQRFVSFKQQGEGQTATAHLLIGGIHCAACVWLLENYLQRLPGVERVNVSLSEHKATVIWRTDNICLSALCKVIAQLGYQPEPYSDSRLGDLQRRENRAALKRLGVAGIAMMQVGMFAIALYAGDIRSIAVEYRDLMRWVSLLVATPVVFYSAIPFFVGAWRGLLMGKPGMDLPVAIAITLAYTASCRATISGSGTVYFDSVTMFTFLLLSGRYLEMRARHFSGKLNSNDLTSLLPSTVTKLVDSSKQFHSVALFTLKKGDTVLIKPGQVVPADGRVVAGCSGVNESQLTGEFKLQNKTIGDKVMAGTLNGEGVLTIQVDAVGAQLQLQIISSLLSQAQAEKPIIAQRADRLASYFVVTVLLLSLVTFVFWQYFDSENAFWITLSVLVVSCPCALSLATPAALVAATSRLRKSGLLVTASQVWESIPAITHVVCDKTGTLTEGKLTVKSIHSMSSLTPVHCMEIASALEAHSEHAIATAFTQKQSIATTVRAMARNVTISIGEGIEGTIDGLTYRIGTNTYTSALYNGECCSERALPAAQSGQWVFLSSQQGPLCRFELQDTVRSSALKMVKALKNRGMIVHMLSGDHSACARQLSDQLGLHHCIYGASAQDKLDYIQHLQKEGAHVLMLGDGINDIPVLAAADISIAMCHASNLAKTHADCILLSGQLDRVIELIDMASKTRKTIQQNLIWALLYNLSAIPLAAMAMIAPYIAAVGMSLSSLVVVINSLRLQYVNKGKNVPQTISTDHHTVSAYVEGVR